MVIRREPARLGRAAPSRPRSSAPGASPEPTRSSDRMVVSLQRAAGNASTRRYLDALRTKQAEPPMVVSRYDTGEHAQFGAGGDVRIHGMFISQGELIAMGDFFEAPDDILRTPKGELAAIVKLIRRAKAADEGKPGAKPVSTAEWEKATKGRYLKLAKKNTKHFAPKHGTKGTAGGDHRGEFRLHHLKAIEMAHAHSDSDRKVPGNALVHNGFAGHFLTDAFSAGHLVSKTGLTDIAKLKFRNLPTTGRIFKENAFTKSVARRVLGDATVKKKLAGMQLKLLAWGPFDTTRFSELLWQMSHKKDLSGAFFSAFAKLVHDGLNQAITAGAGIEVENARGDKWPLAGDETLALSAKTKSLAKAAVAESNKNLELAAHTYGPLDYDAMIDAVWAYTPVPTKKGVKQIRSISKTFLNPSDARTVEAFSKMAIAEIDTAMAELRAAGRLRRKPTARQIPIGTCFAPDTPILLPDGTTRRIDAVAVGDLVVGHDLDTDRPATHRVTATHAHTGARLLRLSVGPDLPSLRVTAEHPIWSEDRAAWVPAGALTPGERLLRVTAAGSAIVKVVGIRPLRSGRDVHNLTVTGAHNYVAGGVLVHNKGP